MTTPIKTAIIDDHEAIRVGRSPHDRLAALTGQFERRCGITQDECRFTGTTRNERDSLTNDGSPSGRNIGGGRSLSCAQNVQSCRAAQSSKSA